MTQHFDMSLPQSGVRTDTLINVGPAIVVLLRNERLVDVTEELIGAGIKSNPVQHVRVKLPNEVLAAQRGARMSMRTRGIRTTVS
ncbi:hypothetical protein BH20ACT8_BH20ACT8_00280 [soil metagenome]